MHSDDLNKLNSNDLNERTLTEAKTCLPTDRPKAPRQIPKPLPTETFNMVMFFAAGASMPALDRRFQCRKLSPLPHSERPRAWWHRLAAVAVDLVRDSRRGSCPAAKLPSISWSACILLAAA